MAFTIVCPPGCQSMFTGEMPKSGDDYIAFPSGNTGSILEIPSTNELHLAMKCSTSKTNDSKIIIIHSQNHEIIIRPAKSGTTFSIFQDDNKIVDTVSYLNDLTRDKVSISLKNEGSNYLTLKVNGKIAAEYNGVLLDGEPITSIEFFEPWGYGSFHMYWLIVSSIKIPGSAAVKTIYPKVETDWEKGEKDAYQTNEVGKTMKLLLPDNATTEGKVILSTVSFLHDVVGGGEVNAISVHTDGVDKDQTIGLCEKPTSIGTFFAGTSTFTTKE